MVIMASAEVLAEKDGIDAETRKGLDRISDSAQRAEDLTRQMLAFSRKQPLRARPTNVNDLVADTGKLLRRTLGGQIEIESILADDVGPVDIDRAQLETSLVNLCLNARDAMPAGGRVLIETQNVSIDAAQAALLPGVSAGPFVQIASAIPAAASCRRISTGSSSPSSRPRRAARDRDSASAWCMASSSSRTAISR